MTIAADTEATPLLLAGADVDAVHDAVYDRFSPSRKRTILAFISWAGLVPLFVSGSFIPAIPQVVKDFDSTATVIGLAVSISIATAAVGNFFWATYSGFYGRRPIYLLSLPILCAASVGVALAQSVPQLMAFRALQAFGASSGISVGAGVIGDIYRLEERGAAMGIFFGAVLVGPAIAPVLGGAATHYSSWRTAQWALAGASFLVFVLMSVAFPETSQPRARGIDKLREGGGADAARGFVWLNPFASLALLRSPNLLATTVTSTVVLLTDMVLCVPLSYTIGPRYGITNEALIGALFLPVGLGNIIGAPISGRLSDRTVVIWRARRGGVWVPEDRLRCAIPAALLVPLSVLLCGLVTSYLPVHTHAWRAAGISANVFLLFCNGIGVDMVLSPCAAYGVDVMHSRSAEVMSAAGGFRSLFIGVALTAVIPLIHTIGVAPTNAIAAVLAWIGCGLLVCTIRYGDRMRAWVDIGYSTVHDN